MPCSPTGARKLLQEVQGAVLQLQPFTIVLKKREGGEVQEIGVKIDPGSKVSRIALVGNFSGESAVVWGANLERKGTAIRSSLAGRSVIRRNRRSRKTRTGKEGRLPPSLQRRVHGFATGDSVKAVVLKGKQRATHSGRVSIPLSGSFSIDTPRGKVDGISCRFCKNLQHADGYQYSQQPRERRFLPRLKSQVSASSVV